jgi:SSS family solute:Na+ symporter
MDIYKSYINKNATEGQMVRVGRIVALIALTIATIIAPQLGSLDQAYQYIQEYTGFIYPGEFLIFFCGLFWKQSSSKAALWTALLTIPLGLVMKVAFPEMPFVLRIGYVFILLSFVMVGMSLADKTRKVENVFDTNKGIKIIRTGYKLIAVAMLAGIVSAFFVHPLRNLALEAIYVPIVMIILTGLIMVLNNTLKKRDSASIVLKDGVFNTSMTFNIAAIGICGILASLYYFFW